MSDHHKITELGPSYRFEVRAEANFPIQDLVYKIDLYDSTLALVYNNLCFAAIAAVMSKAGQIFSEYEITGDLPELEKKQKALMSAIAADEGVNP